ncbi:hypothetical protein QTO30_01670 [Yoonia sp. GPGPB17]|uniref:hypothetical protein n=1 Tax=Yoonia sp. GPGPB17 TaxID=3026147 RepID=UPI0030C60FDC
MIAEPCLNYRFVLARLLVVVSLVWSNALQAQEANTLPDYVIEEFGSPPSYP